MFKWIIKDSHHVWKIIFAPMWSYIDYAWTESFDENIHSELLTYYYFQNGSLRIMLQTWHSINWTIAISMNVMAHFQFDTDFKISHWLLNWLIIIMNHLITLSHNNHQTITSLVSLVQNFKCNFSQDQLITYPQFCSYNNTILKI